jgi:hypothetical protein
MIGIKRFGDKTSITAAFAALTILLLAPAVARAQWSTPDASGNVSSTNTGNVGIGTTTAPTSKLDVNGTAAVSGDLKVATGRLKFTFSGPEGYVQGATERLSFWTTDGSGGQAVRMRFGGNAATSTAEFLNVSSVLLGTGVRFALGITAPEGTFDVRGGVAASGNGLPIILSAQQGAGSGNGGNVIINSGPNGSTGGTGQIIFGIGGGITSGALTSNEKMRITAAGNVGIGTSAPLQKFQLGTNTPTGSTTPDTISLGATYSSAAGANPKLRLYDDNAGSVYGLGSSDHQFDFMTPAATRYVWNINGTEKMRLDASGNVGIGTAAATSYRLNVAGSVNASGGLCIADDCKSTWAQVVAGAATTINAVNVSSGQFGSGVGGGAFSFPASLGVGTAAPDKLLTVQGQIAAPLGVLSVIRTTGSNNGYGLALDAAGTGNNNLGFTLGGTPKASMAWDVANNYLGFVNMAYAQNYFALRLNADGSLAYNDAAGGAERFRVTASGNVGIGTSAPNTAKLVIAGTAGSPGIDLASSDLYAELRIIRNSVGADKDLYLQYQAGASSKTHIYSGNVETVTVSGGKVGVGKTNPTEALDVEGNITATGNIAARYQDVAEWVPSTQKLSAGTVVVLDKSETNHVLASTRAYDTKVAGVVSDSPGVILGVGGEGKLKVATTGRVKVRVDATRSPVEVGDLLVTSEAEGLAMKSVEVDLGGVKIHRPGTIIGKALEPLASGTGEILVLLSLQ